MLGSTACSGEDETIPDLLEKSDDMASKNEHSELSQLLKKIKLEVLSAAVFSMTALEMTQGYHTPVTCPRGRRQEESKVWG